MEQRSDTQCEKLAAFTLGARYEDIASEVIDQLKRHLLDSLGSLIFSIVSGNETIEKLISYLNRVNSGGGTGTCRVPVLGYLSPGYAAQLFTALIRYPDFMDNFLAKESTCHPSDNIGGLLAAAQLVDADGEMFLTAMALGYCLECVLTEDLPVMIRGMDHTQLLAYSVTAELCYLIGLSFTQTSNALAIAGSSVCPLVTSRASYTYEWKGFASSLTARDCMDIVFMAAQNITGPQRLFEGPRGFEDIFAMTLDFKPDISKFNIIRRCILKRFNAEVHAQATLEAVEHIINQHRPRVEEIEKIEIATFLTAYHIIGSGMYGDRKTVHSKEQADHSLFYTVAVLLLDGKLDPGQLTPERINRDDVQALMKKISVRTLFPIHRPLLLADLDPYTHTYPRELCTKVHIHVPGKELIHEAKGYHGFYKDPFSWQDVIEKFRRLTGEGITEETKTEIIRIVQTLERKGNVTNLINILCAIKP